MTKQERYKVTRTRYNRSKITSVYGVYNKPSDEKVAAERNIKLEMSLTGGFDYRIISYNSFEFVAGYQFMDRETGSAKLRVHSSRYTYELDFEE